MNPETTCDDCLATYRGSAIGGLEAVPDSYGRDAHGVYCRVVCACGGEGLRRRVAAGGVVVDYSYGCVISTRLMTPVRRVAGRVVLRDEHGNEHGFDVATGYCRGMALSLSPTEIACALALLAWADPAAVAQ